MADHTSQDAIHRRAREEKGGHRFTEEEKLKIKDLLQVHREREKHLDKEYHPDGTLKEHHQPHWGDGKGNPHGDTK